jgi:hypothetical protein
VPLIVVGAAGLRPHRQPPDPGAAVLGLRERGMAFARTSRMRRSSRTLLSLSERVLAKPSDLDELLRKIDATLRHGSRAGATQILRRRS